MRTANRLFVVLGLAWLATGVSTPAWAQREREPEPTPTRSPMQVDTTRSRGPGTTGDTVVGDVVAVTPTPTIAVPAVPAVPAPTTTTAPPSSQALPKNGAASAAMGLSGLSFLELGYGLTLVARRLRVRRRAIPAYLMRKLLHAAREGQTEVRIADDVFLVRRPPARLILRTPGRVVRRATRWISPPPVSESESVRWMNELVTVPLDENYVWPFLTPPS